MKSSLFQVIKFKLSQLFRSNWSRWVDKGMFIKYHNSRNYLLLIQVKVNSKTGKKRFRETEIMWSYDSYSLVQYHHLNFPSLSLTNGGI